MNRSFYKLLLKILLLIAILVIVDKGVGVCYGFLRSKALDYRPYNLSLRTPYMVEKVKSDIVIVGASDASRHYIPQMISDTLNMSVYNCGQEGRFFIFQNCLINLMLKRYSPKVIIWELLDNCLSYNDAKDEFLCIRDLYPYYKDGYCRTVINSEDKKQKLIMMSQMYRINSRSFGCIFPFIINDSTDNGFVPLDTVGYFYPTFSYKQVAQNINNDKVKMLEKTIENCKEHKVQLIFASSPSFTDNYVKSTIQYKKLKELADEYEVPFIDSFDDEKIFRDSTLFKDCVHLNERGAKRYMQWFIPQLKKYIK